MVWQNQIGKLLPIASIHKPVSTKSTLGKGNLITLGLSSDGLCLGAATGSSTQNEGQHALELAKYCQPDSRKAFGQDSALGWAKFLWQVIEKSQLCAFLLQIDGSGAAHELRNTKQDV